MDQGYLRTRMGCQERDHDQRRKERLPQESSQKLYAIHFNSDERTLKLSLPHPSNCPSPRYEIAAGSARVRQGWKYSSPLLPNGAILASNECLSVHARGGQGS